MFWTRLEDIFARRMTKTNIFLLIKTFSRCLLKTYEQGEYIDLDQDVLKTSSEDKDKRRLQDVFTKTKICWEVTWVEVWRLSCTWIVCFFGKSLYQQIYVLRVQVLHLQYEYEGWHHLASNIAD